MNVSNNLSVVEEGMNVDDDKGYRSSIEEDNDNDIN